MTKTPKCPGCGDEMSLHHLMIDDVFCFICPKCKWTSPVCKSSEAALETALRRVDSGNRVLTLEEVKAHCEGGADATPLWYERKDYSDTSRWMLIDLPELSFDSAATVKRLVNSQFFGATYGEKWRCWLRKPTQQEMENHPWEGATTND